MSNIPYMPSSNFHHNAKLARRLHQHKQLHIKNLHWVTIQERLAGVKVPITTQKKKKHIHSTNWASHLLIHSDSHYMAQHTDNILHICKCDELIVQYTWESFDICYGKVIKLRTKHLTSIQVNIKSYRTKIKHRASTAKVILRLFFE